MRKQQDWDILLQIEPAFQELEENILSGAIQDYREIPPQSFSWHARDLIPEERLFTLLLPFLRQQVSRAKLAMGGLYAESPAKIQPEDFQSREGWFKVPVSVKDDQPEFGIRGFRQSVRDNPSLLRTAYPATACVSLGSGGSLGKYTPTYMTTLDRQREVQAWRRGHDYHGLVEGDIALYAYNTTHKGGQWMQESLWSHQCQCLPAEARRRPGGGPGEHPQL